MAGGVIVILKIIQHLFCHRHPDIVIGETDNPYLNRWHIARNNWFSIYVHQFLRDDDDRALHDHPWASVSIVLSGGYFDVTPGPDGSQQRRWYGPGNVIFRGATATHRVELRTRPNTKMRWYFSWEKLPAWTLFIAGPRIREWGFHCPQGWVHWRKFTAGKNGETIGKGCDQ